MFKHFGQYEKGKLLEEIDEALECKGRVCFQNNFHAPNVVVKHLVNKGYNYKLSLDNYLDYGYIRFHNPITGKNIKVIVSITTAFKRGFTFIKPSDDFQEL